jgi:phenylacetate-coenzyme A ligase PaaK-like adenylate-forming protein
MFVHPNQSNDVVSRFPEIAAYQLVVTRSDNRDNMVMLIELAGQLSDKEKWLEALDKDFRNVCKVRYDEVRFVTKGTIPAQAKRIVDERTY